MTGKRIRVRPSATLLIKATLVWQSHNTCLDMAFQHRYRGFSMHSLPKLGAFGPNTENRSSADNASLRLLPVAELMGKQVQAVECVNVWQGEGTLEIGGAMRAVEILR
jgi:hypothetical protein